MNMEEHVQKLYELQSKRDVEKELADKDILVIEQLERVAAAKSRLEMAELALADELAESKQYLVKIEEEIEATKAQIIELWDGEAKTIVYNGGLVLKLRTTQSVVVADGAALLAELLAHFSTNLIADEYITGFKKTAVRKFMDVIPVRPDVVALIAKTTVKLEKS